MRVVHWAPFAPSRCGLYEAARDCARADYLRDHEVLFVDTGVTVGHGEREAPKVGVVDLRGGWLLETVDPARAYDADLWVCHDGVPDLHSARCQVPMIWVIHGRPLACFRPEQNGAPGRPFSIVQELATWPRVKVLVTMWSEHEPFWRMLAGDKLRSTIDPPLDGARFKPVGEVRPLVKPGAQNVLICDSWREDIDVYEVAVGCWEAARQRPGIRVHFWAVDPGKENTSWQIVWRALERIGALGEIHARETDMDATYRAMDAVVTPHTIAVRTISEALSCGTPVVAGAECRYTPWRAPASDPVAVARAILQCLDAGASRQIVAQTATPFDLAAFGRRMETIYQEAVA